jgi:hypothetical protein
MENQRYVEEEWPYILSLMPRNLEELCGSKLAMTRRREIANASDYLRLCMAYSICDMSLRQTAAWATAIGLADLSDVAVLKRLRTASGWLGSVIAEWLYERGLTTGTPGRKVCIVDATTVSKPGSMGTDYRLHMRMDLNERRIGHVELTEESGGERLDRHEIGSGEIILGDRGYASKKGIAHVIRSGGHVVIRSRCNLDLTTRGGRHLDMVALLDTLAVDEIGDWPVLMNYQGLPYPLRLVAIRKSAHATEKEQRAMRREARKKGSPLYPTTLKAAGYIVIVTDLPPEELTCMQVLELYRLRWQIELMFKRLKSILGFDRLRAKDDNLSQTYLLTKIFGALVIDELSGKALDFFPWGFRLPTAPTESLAIV